MNLSKIHHIAIIVSDYEGGLTAAGEKTAAWLKKNDLGRK